MTAKLVVFPIRGRNWCFSRSVDPSMIGAESSNAPSTLKELYNRIFSSPQSSESSSKFSNDSKFEVVIDFVANKMNAGWSNLEKAPQGTIKNKIHGLGSKLLSRVKPSEIFFKSIPKEVNSLEITYPLSLNPRLVRRRLRHLAFRGSVIHQQYFYKSAIVLPLTSVFMVLPLPNFPFFWVLFRTYSHWKARQGSEKLLHLVTDSSSSVEKGKVIHTTSSSDEGSKDSMTPPWVFKPSEELEKLLHNDGGDQEGISEAAISQICQKFYLNTMDVVRFRNSTSSS